MILEKTVGRDIELSVISCDPTVELDTKVYLFAYVRFSHQMIFRPLRFLLERRTISLEVFQRERYHNDRLTIMAFKDGRSVLEALSQKRWIDMCRRFSLLSIHVAGLMRSLPDTHYAAPLAGMYLYVFSYSPNEGATEKIKEIAAQYDVIVTFSGRKIALLGYRLFSEQWRSIQFPQNNIVILSAFERVCLQDLCQSNSFAALRSCIDFEEIGFFQS